MISEEKSGEGGIRTLGTSLSSYNGLANRPFRPLRHLSNRIFLRVAKIKINCLPARFFTCLRNIEKYAPGLTILFCSENQQVKIPCLHGGQLYFLLEFQYIFPENTICVHQVFYSLAGMDYRSMITATKMLADCF